MSNLLLGLALIMSFMLIIEGDRSKKDINTNSLKADKKRKHK